MKYNPGRSGLMYTYKTFTFISGEQATLTTLFHKQYTIILI